MGLRKDVKEIKTKLDFLSSETAEKAKKYEQTMSDLKNVSIKLHKVVRDLDEHGDVCVKIFYEVEPIVLKIDDDNKHTEFNQRFYSMNVLNLLSIEDMQEIQRDISDAIAYKKSLAKRK